MEPLDLGDPPILGIALRGFMVSPGEHTYNLRSMPGSTLAATRACLGYFVVGEEPYSGLDSIHGTSQG
jgi:hypothetical protein